jgi:hypothetical protein
LLVATVAGPADEHFHPTDLALLPRGVPAP